MTSPREVCFRTLVAAALASASLGGAARGQGTARGVTPAPVERITIPFLANASRPADLDYAAAECEVAPGRDRMQCRLRQVFLTPTSIDPSTCAITTNGYALEFRRESSARWTHTSEPEGPCRIVETTTLEDGGGTRWTMIVRRGATAAPATPECATLAPTEEVFDWRTVQRKLPCTSVRPGALEK